MMFSGKYDSPFEPGASLVAFDPAVHLPLLRSLTDQNPFTLTDQDRARLDVLYDDVIKAPNAMMFAVQADDRCLGVIYFTEIEIGLNAWIHAYGVPGCCSVFAAAKGMRVALDAAFGAWGLMRVSTVHAMGNRVSTAICERAGFKQEGLIRSVRMYQGEAHDCWLGGIIRGEWHAGRHPAQAVAA